MIKIDIESIKGTFEIYADNKHDFKIDLEKNIIEIIEPNGDISTFNYNNVIGYAIREVREPMTNEEINKYVDDNASMS